jgi:hypothetical protein
MNRLSDLLDWATKEQKLVEALECYSFQVELQKLIDNKPIILVRNWYGQLMLLLPCTRSELERSECVTLVEDLRLKAGVLALPTWVMCHDELFGADAYWNDPSLILLTDNLMLLERQDKDRDWLLPVPLSNIIRKAKRCVFFSIKGGVGRSSALTMLAIELARRGKRVLVVDGDFESPGLSSSLLPRGEGQPYYGVVDWLTAQALGADADTLQRMALEQVVEHSPLNARLGLSGQLLVAPAYGQKTQAYVAKLARLHRQSSDGKSYAQRLNQCLNALETEHRIDITLFDSRAGIDETSAAAITQLKTDISFLFAIDTSQTWDSYRLLFQHLQRNKDIEDVRENLSLVSALTPENAGMYAGYSENFQDNAYDTFTEIYDEDSGDDGDVYAPAPNDEDAPHHAARIMWNEALRAFNPLGYPDLLRAPTIQASFADFLQKTITLLEIEE